MKLPLSHTLRRLDRYWLLNSPVLWIMRPHRMVFRWIFGLALICLIAIILPLPVAPVSLAPVYFLTVFMLAGLVVAPWVFFQLRLAPQLRQDSQARSAIYLLVGYFFIASIYLAWPYAFVRILEWRISNRITITDLRIDHDQLRQMIAGKLAGAQEPDKAYKLSSKYEKPARIDSPTGADSTTPLTLAEILVDRPLFSLLQLLLFLVLILRVAQLADADSFVTTMLLVVCEIFIIVYCFTSDRLELRKVALLTLLLLFLWGVYFTVFREPPNRKSALFMSGLNVFTLLLMWVPIILVGLFSLPTQNERIPVSALFLGDMLVFSAMPWAQRRYLNLQAKPST